jgi:hypothetical protein
MKEFREANVSMTISPRKSTIVMGVAFAILMGLYLPLVLLIMSSILSAGYCAERYPGGIEPPELQLNFLKLGIVILLNLCMWGSFAFA